MSDFEIVGSEDFFATIYRRGAYVGQIVKNGKKILKETEDGIDIKGGIPILVPYGDLVRNAKYTFHETEYHLPKNAHVVGNYRDSIHGLARTQEWNVKKRNDNSISIFTEINDPGYPSILGVEITYTIIEGSFAASISVVNIGEVPAPLVIGAHPYFAISGPWKLHHQDRIQMLNYPDGIFPDGKMIDYSFNDINNPEKLNLDSSFVGGGTLKLESKYSTIILERINMTYFEVYNGTFAGKNSVALEPLTGAIDAFNNGIGLKEISSGEKFECGFRITIY